MSRRHERTEDGAVLVMALILITAIAVVTGALLTKGSGNFKTTVQLRGVAGAAYSADAAAKAAIGVLQQGSDAGALNGDATYPDMPSGQKWVYDNYADGTGCFGYQANGSTPKTDLVLRDFYPATGSVTAASSVRVECAPVPGTGLLGSGQGVPVTGANSPARALTLLGNGSSTGDGLQVKPLGSGNDNRFVVAGGLATNAGIGVSNGDLFSSTYAWARTGCSGTIITPSKDCSHAAVSDPGYAAAISSVPTYQPIPAGCTFSPGYYDDANALTARTSSCATSVFSPGAYYFDFHNNAADPTYSANAMTGGSSNVWTITNTVIGGTSTGSSTSPGRCDSPIEKASANGVQFVFGGDSRIMLGGSGRLELCASSSTSAPQIALFGLSSGSAAVLQSPAGVSPGSVTATGFTGATPAALGAVGGAQATWSTTGNATATVTMGGLAPATAPPAGSLLKSATLQVRHRETTTGGGSRLTPSLQVKVGSAAAVDTATQPVARTALTTDSLDLTADLAKAVHDGNLGSTQLLFTETARGTTSSVLDFVQLTLTYYPPTLRPQTATAFATNCIPTGACSFVDSGTNSGATFVVNGVTYAPNASIAIDPGNGNGLVAFRYGLVARGLDMKGQPKYSFGYPVVSIPDQGPGFGSNVTAVDLKVYVCVGQSTCSSGGTLTLTSRVKLTDPVNALPAPLTRKVEVLSWSEQR